jgi:hypothetical protein
MGRSQNLGVLVLQVGFRFNLLAMAPALAPANQQG